MRNVFTLLLLPILCTCASAQKETDTENFRNWVVSSDRKDKVALVIGNSKYGGDLELDEPASDAQTMAGALESQGYDVMIGYNLDRSALISAVFQFADSLSHYQEGIVYYAGHGIEIAGENYFVPIGADFNDYDQAADACYPVDNIFNQIGDPEKPKLVIIDACRENPFKNSELRDAPFKLDFSEKTVENFRNASVVFSTATTTVVKDSNVFTEEFAKRIRLGGCLDGILGEVSEAVWQDNNGQLVDRAGILVRQICFGTVNGENPTLTDTDEDGVTDDKDACVLAKGPAEFNGCPMLSTVEWRRHIDEPGISSFYYAPEVARLTRIGNATARARLGYLHLTGRGVLANPNKARSLFEEATGDDGFAEYNLGVMQEDEKYGQPNKFEARNQYKKGADLGDPNAWFNLGVILYQDAEEKPDYKAALDCFLRAAEGGLLVAYNALGELYQFELQIKTDLKEALANYQRGSAGGDPAATTNLGRMYVDGQVVDRDLERAEELFRKAMAQNHPEAYTLLGDIYLKEFKDQDEAFKLYHKAAEMGDADAQFNLGNMYKRGYGGRGTRKEAEKWHRKAAEQGHKEAKKLIKDG